MHAGRWKVDGVKEEKRSEQIIPRIPMGSPKETPGRRITLVPLGNPTCSPPDVYPQDDNSDVFPRDANLGVGGGGVLAVFWRCSGGCSRSVLEVFRGCSGRILGGYPKNQNTPRTPPDSPGLYLRGRVPETQRRRHIKISITP